MIRNYLKIAWRSLLKNKNIFIINSLGLAIGIATCLTISLFVADEISYDRFNTNATDTYRVVLDAKMGDELIKEAAIMAPVASALKQELPEIKRTTRIHKFTDAAKVAYQGKAIRKGKLVMVDSTFFDVFTCKFLSGQPKTALNRPNTVVLTQEQAEAYFGKTNPMNKSIHIKDIGIWNENGFQDFSGLFTVTGIIEKMPLNSHFHFDILASMASNTLAKNESWLQGQYYTYITLNESVEIKNLEAKIRASANKHLAPEIKAKMGMSLEESIAKGNKFGLALQPLLDIHLQSDLRGELEQGGSLKTVTIFGAVALFMLLIACINFMNLSTASASKRVKEIGMRKVLGSAKSQLVNQFLSESFISTVFAMLLGVGIFSLCLPFFNQLANKHIEISSFFNVKYISILAILTLIISLLAGTYPAFFMSSFNTLQALKNRFTNSGSKSVRSGLVVFQFAISATLIIGTLVVNRQMNYIQNKDVGYNRKSLIVLREAGFLGNNLDAFRNELKNDVRVKSITKSAFVPAGPTDSNMQGVIKANDPTQRIRIKQYGIDEEYIPTLGMKLISGRNFTKATDENTLNVIINETAIKSIGLPQNPIGKTIKMTANSDGTSPIITVVGVIKDFHARSLREPIEPLIMKYNPYFSLIIKAEDKDIPGLIKSMESRWNSFGTGEAFNYAFLDELYNETYLREANMNSLLRIFAILTIFVACLGLFGLVTFTTEQRFKEIGIRKVLGSSVPQIVGLLSKDFLKLIVVSFLIAFPLGYYAMQNWLQDFEYRTELQWWVFVVAGLITVLIAFITISYRSIQAALMNPVKSLKTE
ncbi:MAG: ABC transporter permease [Leadbetterella sp.]|jgi:putative ABC transport system permease protein|nr:ABC transporter permease [Leadbetterella sp.]